MKKVRSLLVLALVAVLLVTGCTRDPENQPVRIPVGIVVSLTGNFSPYGIIQKKGLMMAFDELNSLSDSSGFVFDPTYMDDSSSPDSCLRVYRDLIENKMVMAIIGPTSSNCAFAADTVAQRLGVPVIGISNTVPGITEMGNFIFRNSLPESAVIPNTVSETHLKMGYSRAAVIFGDDDPYTLGTYSVFRSALEGTPDVRIVATEVVKKGDIRFDDQLLRVKAAAPDLIVIAALVNEASKLMVQARQAGIPDNVRFLGGNSFNTSQLWQQAGTAAEGALCGTAWIASNPTPGSDEFVTGYVSRYGSEPDQFAAQAYASMQILADAAARGKKPDRSSLRDALALTTNLQTILGVFSFDANRNPVHEPVVQELVNGRFVLLN